MIATAVGHIAIEAIEAGDWVWATNPETGETELKQVVQTFVNEASELVHLTTSEETITATPTHPFYVPEKGWVSAIDLRAGDILVTVNGEYVILEKVQHEILESPVTVYNFEVEGFHTYHVGEQSLLVHNRCSDFDDDLPVERIGRQKGNAPRSNQAQNKQFNSIVKEFGLSKKEARTLHDAITGQGYSRDEIIEELIFLFPEKGG